MTKKRKASDREAEVAMVVVAATEAAERGGRSGGLRIGSDLTPAQKHAVLHVEERHGTPPGTIMLGGCRVGINVTEPRQEEPETEAKTEEPETEAEGHIEGQTEVQ